IDLILRRIRGEALPRGGLRIRTAPTDRSRTPGEQGQRREHRGDGGGADSRRTDASHETASNVGREFPSITGPNEVTLHMTPIKPCAGPGSAGSTVEWGRLGEGQPVAMPPLVRSMRSGNHSVIPGAAIMRTRKTTATGRNHSSEMKMSRSVIVWPRLTSGFLAM